jgi:hypothetical protein
MLGDLRAWRKVKGRKHKDKYKPHKMLIETDDEKIEYAAESPDVRLDLTFMYAFEHPTILAGQPPLAIWVPKFEFMWIAMAMGKNAESHAKQFYPNPKRLTTSAAFNPTIFAKMIAKIGYSFAFAEALGRFEPLGGRAIVGLDPWFPNYLVGGEPDQAPKSEYQTETGLLRWPDVNGKEYLVARVRLFGEFGAPVYYAVVGEL